MNLKFPQEDWDLHGFVALDEDTRQKVEGRQSIGNATEDLIDEVLADEDDGDDGSEVNAALVTFFFQIATFNFEKFHSKFKNTVSGCFFFKALFTLRGIFQNVCYFFKI